MSEADILFGASAGFGEITGCEPKSDGPNEQKDRARAKNRVGTEVNHKFKNVRTEYTAVYNIISDTNDIQELILGSVMNGRVVTSIAISTGNGEENNTITLTGHNHAVKAHADNLPQIAIASLLPVGGIPAFGAVDFGGGTPGDDASPVSGSITFACQHNDKTDKDGDHLVGTNHDAMANGTTTFEGVPTTPVDAAVWETWTSKETPVDNEDFQSTTTNFTAPLVLADPVIPAPPVP